MCIVYIGKYWRVTKFYNDVAEILTYDVIVRWVDIKQIFVFWVNFWTLRQSMQSNNDLDSNNF